MVLLDYSLVSCEKVNGLRREVPAEFGMRTHGGRRVPFGTLTNQNRADAGVLFLYMLSGNV